MGNITPNAIFTLIAPVGASGQIGEMSLSCGHFCDHKFLLTPRGLRCLIHMTSVPKYCISREIKISKVSPSCTERKWAFSSLTRKILKPAKLRHRFQQIQRNFAIILHSYIDRHLLIVGDPNKRPTHPRRWTAAMLQKSKKMP